MSIEDGSQSPPPPGNETPRETLLRRRAELDTRKAEIDAQETLADGWQKVIDDLVAKPFRSEDEEKDIKFYADGIKTMREQIQQQRDALTGAEKDWQTLEQNVDAFEKLFPPTKDP